MTCPHCASLAEIERLKALLGEKEEKANGQ